MNENALFHRFPRSFYVSGAGKIPVFACAIVVVGSGAAAYNAAHTAKIALKSRVSAGERKEETIQSRVSIVTEGRRMGTSRNTGSDKQTYYKLATAAGIPDSAREMAEDLMRGGSMHGDLALTEALGSPRGFYKLVSLGVPFPHDRYGEYTGYRTDHDEKKRATSCGPLTSKLMTEVLEEAALSAGAELFDGYRVVELLTVSEGEKKRCVGVIALSTTLAGEENPAGACVFLSSAVIWATGGPSAVYHNSVYPESQTCGLGAPLRAGASAVNLTEWQYGMASLTFRWNVSGSYQQVLPRYLSTDGASGDAREFLFENSDVPADSSAHRPLFSSPKEALAAVFGKGYEWPFDPSKLDGKPSASSRIDLAVYREIEKGRRVYLDFRENPAALQGAITEEKIGGEAWTYLKNCHALGETPVKRLRQMNEKAYQLYLSHGIDLEKEPLEIGVCAQHMNGGLEGGIWYESPLLRSFYPVGEACGVFGVRRPGGAALNSTQVSAQRAAEKAAYTVQKEVRNGTFGLCWNKALSEDNRSCGSLESGAFGEDFHANTGGTWAMLRRLASSVQKKGLDRSEFVSLRQRFAKKMDACGAFLRKEGEMEALRREIALTLSALETQNPAKDVSALVEREILRDTLTTAYAMLFAMLSYIRDGGLSRGSYQIAGTEGLDERHSGVVQQVTLTKDGPVCVWETVRPIPTAQRWFEEVYNQFSSVFEEE